MFGLKVEFTRPYWKQAYNCCAIVSALFIYVALESVRYWAHGRTCKISCHNQQGVIYSNFRMVTNDDGDGDGDGDGEENVISECNFSFSYYFFTIIPICLT